MFKRKAVIGMEAGLYAMGVFFMPRRLSPRTGQAKRRPGFATPAETFEDRAKAQNVSSAKHAAIPAGMPESSRREVNL
jgi:hypothetical protein